MEQIRKACDAAEAAGSFEDLLDSTRQHALHLELLGVYAVGEEQEVYRAISKVRASLSRHQPTREPV
ncbi:hypothetical protein AB0G20_22005 [Streptomyces sp. NPDC024017]|uniref:hypothetical protein n=1 Tax=Streptomyces sp. NPDC024017 TaxID=3154326 RepID=UPI00340749C2